MFFEMICRNNCEEVNDVAMIVGVTACGRCTRKRIQLILNLINDCAAKSMHMHNWIKMHDLFNGFGAMKCDNVCMNIRIVVCF